MHFSCVPREYCSIPLNLHACAESLTLRQVLPQDIREPLVQHENRASLLEVCPSTSNPAQPDKP